MKALKNSKSTKFGNKIEYDYPVFNFIDKSLQKDEQIITHALEYDFYNI